MRISGSKVFLIFVAVLALLALSAVQVSAQSAAETLYKGKCAMCHGADGKGDTPVGKKMGAHDFTSADVQKQTDEQLTDTIAKGKNKMPGYEKSLKPEQIKDLVGFIRGLGKKK